MLFSQEEINNPFSITGFSDDSITINGQVYQQSLIISPSQLIRDWPPQSFAELQESHLDALIALQPTVIILGTGTQQAFIPAAWQAKLFKRKIGLETMKTQAACRTFNVLLSEGRNVVAGLLL